MGKCGVHGVQPAGGGVRWGKLLEREVHVSSWEHVGAVLSVEELAPYDMLYVDVSIHMTATRTGDTSIAQLTPRLGGGDRVAGVANTTLAIIEGTSAAMDWNIAVYLLASFYGGGTTKYWGVHDFVQNPDGIYFYSRGLTEYTAEVRQTVYGGQVQIG